MSEATPIYKVIFLNQNKVYELYAKAIYQSEMYGFVEVEEFVFGEVSQMIVDPGEEKLKNEFAGVTRSYIPCIRLFVLMKLKKKAWVKLLTLLQMAAVILPLFPCRVGQGLEPMVLIR